MGAVEEIIQKKFRVTIPAALREKLFLREGDTVLVKLEGGRLIVEPKWLVEHPTRDLASLGIPRKMVTDPEELEERLRKYRSTKAGD